MMWRDMGVPASHGSAEPLWRAIAVYRFARLGYAVLPAILNRARWPSVPGLPAIMNGARAVASRR